MSADFELLDPVHAEKAQRGLRQIEDAILGLLQAVPSGLGNAEIARELGLKTGARRQKNYLTWSILQEMIARKILSTVPRPGRSREVLYVLPYA